MTSFINVFNRIFALFFAAALFVTGGVNSIFNGDIYRYESSDGVVGIETLTRAQGVTNDGGSFIYSGKHSLEKVSLDGKTILVINTSAIPKELKEKYGSAHIGGISCYDGIIYAAVEDSKVWAHPLVVLYDAATLEYTGVFYELPTELHKRGVPWVTADGEHGILYTGDSRNFSEIFTFDINTGEYLGALTFDNEIKKIQGGEYYDGYLYFGTNDINRACYKVDVTNGKTEKLFDRIKYQYKYIDNFGGEGEDITVLPLEDGTFIHTLQIGATFTDATLRHYK